MEVYAVVRSVKYEGTDIMSLHTTAAGAAVRRDELEAKHFEWDSWENPEVRAVFIRESFTQFSVVVYTLEE